MISVQNLSISFAGMPLFENISYRLGAGDRVGLVGKNGAGKSTMLKVLAKDYEATQGGVATEKGVTIGFLRQDIDFQEGRTVLEESYQAFQEIQKLQKRIDFINNELATRQDYESESYMGLIEELSDKTTHFDMIGGYQYQGTTERILLGLGFKRSDFDKLTETFSGGWRMRIELAKLLLQNNDILLLDEPTNHLDIESIIWLENFLKQYQGVVVIVSHDKMFLDNVTNRTIEISLGRAYDYNKPYSQYLVLREEIRTQQLAAQKNQEKQIAHTEKLIEKFKAKATKASMAQSLMKKLDKIDRIEVDQQDTAVMKLNFPVSVQPGKVILELEDVSKSYGDTQILKDIELMIERGTKTAFVGQNGQGKSTLAKIMVNDIPKSSGVVKHGHNIQIGYFAQNQSEALDGEITILDTMINAANESNRSRVRDLLGSFLFQGEDVDKKVKVLSGGERNRLALCKLLLQPFNVLVMDEPTNHLDIRSKNVLKEALIRFEGTLIVVSHDRDFLQGLTNVVYEFKDQKIKPYLGDIDYYLEVKEVEDFRAIEKISPDTKKSSKEKLSKQEGSTKQINPAVQKQLQSLQKKSNSLESKITKYEKQVKQLDKQLAENYEKLMSDQEFFKKYEDLKKQLDTAVSDWETINMEIEELSL